MQLKKVSIEENEFKNGLKAIEMDRLGQIVAIFGPNGAGKTRLLNCIETMIKTDNRFLKLNIDNEEKQLSETLLKLQQEMLKTQNDKAIDSDEPSIKKRYSGLVKQEKDVNEQIKNLKRSKERISSAYSSKPRKDIPLLKLSLGGNISQQSRNQNVMPLQNTIRQLENLEKPSNVGDAVFSFLHHIVNAAFQSKHPEIDNREIEENLNLFREAERIIKIMMKMKLSYVVKGTDTFPTLGGRELNLGELSNGQFVILTYLAYLLSELLSQHKSGQNVTLKDAIIIMDEPELHLHPEAFIQTINHMRKVVGKNGQIWIATHAVSLLPYLKIDEIWTMSAGELSPPGIERYHRAAELLVGSGENFEKLQNFLQEPYHWAAARFATECLMEPQRVSFRKGDPQLFQIGKQLEDKLRAGKDITILDYGAGKGRLAMMVKEIFDAEQKNQVVYIPVEPDESCHKEIKENAGNMLGKCGVIKAGDELIRKYKKKIDVAILCNVLHEIHPRKWANEFEIIQQLLNSRGSLIICEDQEISIGELPHELGFIILGHRELDILFSLNGKLNYKWHSEEQYKERLLCAEIVRNKIMVSPKSVRNALESLRWRLSDLIKDMRTKDKKPSAREGRKYALSSQMLVNCQFVLEELGQKQSSANILDIPKRHRAKNGTLSSLRSE